MNVFKVAAWIPVSREFDRDFRPWLYADQPQFPMIDPFPFATRVRDFAAKWCGRLSDAWSVLRGLDEDVDGGWDY